MDEDKKGILTTAKDVAVETGTVVIDTAKAGFEGTKDLAVSPVPVSRRGGNSYRKEGSPSRQ